jgi:hypothetical protein
MSLGNRSFQGFGLHPDLARRLEDLARAITTLQQQGQQPAAAPAKTTVPAPKKA